MLTEIQKKILTILIKNQGEISNKELQQQLKIGLSTLYTYLDELSGLCVTRKWGGLEITSQAGGSLKSVFLEKLQTERKEKEELADFILKTRYLKHGDKTLLDCGTTTYIIAEKIIENQMTGLDIITVNPYVLLDLLKYPQIGKVSLVGGILNWSDGSLFGPLTVESLKNVAEIGTVIIGVDAIDKKGDLGINDPLEVEQKKIMLEKAKRILIPITVNKLDRAIAYSLGNINELLREKEIIIFIPGKYSEYPEKIHDIVSFIGKNRFIFTNENT